MSVGDVHVLPDVFPVVVEETDVMLMSLHVVVETGPQVGREMGPRTCYCPSGRLWWILQISGISEICRTCFR